MHSLKMSNSSIWPTDMTLSGAMTLGQSGPASNGNVGVLHIPQSSCITGASPSDCLVSYPGHSLEEWVLTLYKDAVGVFYSCSWLGYLLQSPVQKEIATLIKNVSGIFLWPSVWLFSIPDVNFSSSLYLYQLSLRSCHAPWGVFFIF